MRAPARVLGSGRFVTRWSFATTLSVSVTVMAPAHAGASAGAWIVAALIGWSALACALGVVGFIERRLRGTRLRGAVVIAGILVGATLRPLAQDAWLGSAAAGQLPLRIATNVVVWLVVLTATAVTVDALRSLRATNVLLRSASVALDSAAGDARAFEAAAGGLLDDTVRSVRAAVDALGAEETPRAGSVRILADRMRAASHALGSFAEAAATGPPAAVSSSARGAPRPPFRLPPVGVVTLVYLACVLPYAVRSVTSVHLALGLIAVVLGGVAVDGIPRLRALVRHRIGAFAVLSVLVGAALAALSALAHVPAPLSLIPLVVYPAVGVGAGLGAGALRALRAERRRLSGRVAAAQRRLRGGTRSARAALRAASATLHRDAQGACIALALTRPQPSVDDIAALVARLHGVLDDAPRVDAARAAPAGPGSIDDLLSTWEHVMDVRVRFPAAVREALEVRPGERDDVFEVVAEGLLNVAKHGERSEACVTIEVVATGAGAHVRVRVVSPGSLGAGVRLRPDSPAGAVGARLGSDADAVVLEASVPLSDTVPVVSPEHPGRARSARS